MLDNALIALIIQAIQNGETIAGIPGLPIVQNYQPTIQGTPSQSTIFLYKIGDHAYGWQGRTDNYNQTTEQMIHTETQQYETTFQINALAIQNPKTPQNYTASDILNAVRWILQSEATIDFLESNSVGIERITQIRNAPFVDDYDRFEYNPSFDVVFTHKQIISNVIPVITEEVFQIYPI